MERCNNKAILVFSWKKRFILIEILLLHWSVPGWTGSLAAPCHWVFWWGIGCWLCSPRKILSAHTRTWLTALLLLIHFIQPSSSQTNVYLNGNVAKREERGKWGFLRWQSRVLVTASGRQFRPSIVSFIICSKCEMKEQDCYSETLNSWLTRIVCRKAKLSE